MSGDYLSRLFSLEGRVAIVTGAARGNGLALAEALANAGAAVLMVDLLRDELSIATETLSRQGLKVASLALNLIEVGSPERVVVEVLSRFGRCDILVNNAGITRGGHSLEYSAKDWDDTYQTNLRVPFELSQCVGREMKLQGQGSIINITSLNAVLAFPENPAYVAFKGGLKQLTKALALDFGPFGIRVNSIGPGYVKTHMTSRSWADDDARALRAERSVLKRWGEPGDLAGAVIYLASNASSFVTGQDLYVDGGWLIKGL